MRRATGRMALLIAVIAFALLPSRGEAVDLRNGVSLTIDANEQINDDLYLFGSDIVINGTVNGDVVAAGNSILVNGVINGSLTVLGNSLIVTGTVRDSLRASVAQVRIAGTVGHDLLAAAWNADIQPVSKVGRDAYLAMASGNVAGSVGRDFNAAGIQIGLNSSVGGSVDLIADTVTVGAGTNVTGEFRYRSERQAQIASSAKILGAVTQLQPEPQRQPSAGEVGSSRVDLQACKLEYSIVSPK